MNPYMNSLAYKLLAEELADADSYPARKSEWGKYLRHRLGSVLVTVGEKMQASGLETPPAFEDGGYPALDEEACASQ